MSSNATPDRGKPYDEAYPFTQRQADAESHIMLAAAGGFLPLTSCTRIAQTYGVLSILKDLKALKGKLFPEYACNGER